MVRFIRFFKHGLDFRSDDGDMKLVVTGMLLQNAQHFRNHVNKSSFTGKALELLQNS